MKELLKGIIWWSSVGTLVACAATSSQKPQPMVIPSPAWQYRSPEVDFAKIKALCIFPPTAAAESPEVTSSLGLSIYQHLKARYPDWRVVSYVDLQQAINQQGLGRGYQNYMADYSTFARVGMATPAFSAETKSFFNALYQKVGCDTLLFVDYNFSSGIMYSNLRIDLNLYRIPEGRSWWIARIDDSAKAANWQQLVDVVAQSIAQNLGQGTLKQL